ncbi:MAG: histidine kinase dimerization/phospho-acceptor domain-containing protein [Chloroflexia bacterium]
METPPPGNLHEAATWWDDVPTARGRGLLWSRPAGLAVALLGLALLTLPLVLTDRPLGTLISPSLIYLPLIVAVAYGWGGRVGAATALGSFLAAWFIIIPPRYSFALPASTEWTRTILLAVTYAALALVGDAARRLRRANQRLETIIASIADGIMVVDQRGDLLHSNDAMRQMLGTDVPRTVAERNALWQTRATSGAALEPGTGPTTRALQGVTSTRSELLLRAADGSDLVVSVSGAPLRGRSRRIVGAVIVCRDITGMRRLQQAKDDFLTVASHELKTPLTALGGYAQMLRQRLTRIDLADDRALRYLVALETQARRMGELVNTLLDISRLDAGRPSPPSPCDLAALVRETADQLGDLSAQHTVTVAAPASLTGFWDADRIEQVVVNLLTNAIRHPQTAGRSPSPSAPPTNSPDTTPPAALVAPAAYVSLRDQGLGIPPTNSTPSSTASTAPTPTPSLPTTSATAWASASTSPAKSSNATAATSGPPPPAPPTAPPSPSPSPHPNRDSPGRQRSRKRAHRRQPLKFAPKLVLVSDLGRKRNRIVRIGAAFVADPALRCAFQRARRSDPGLGSQLPRWHRLC